MGDNSSVRSPIKSNTIVNPTDSLQSSTIDRLLVQEQNLSKANFTAIDVSTAVLSLSQSDSAAATTSIDPGNDIRLADTKKSLGFLSKIKQLITQSANSLGCRDIKTAKVVKVTTHSQDTPKLSDLRMIQSVQHHSGPIWTVCASADGHYIATGGQDSIVRVWSVKGSAGELEMGSKNLADESADNTYGNNSNTNFDARTTTNTTVSQNDVFDPAADYRTPPDGIRNILQPAPYRLYCGHKADVIDLAFSKSNFLLSASIDKTVQLWHVGHQICLCLFKHADFVTAVAFHPIEDQYFLSGSFDKKLRIWNIPEHRVVEWVQTTNIITAATFNPSGQIAVAGLYNGECVFYHADGLKYFTHLQCKNRHGKNRKGKKVTGFSFSSDGKQLLVSTNDSRIRLYDMDDYSMLGKFKGALNDELQIRAQFSDDNKSIICGSENECVYIWNCSGIKANHTNDSYEYFKATVNKVTSAQFLHRNLINVSRSYYDGGNYDSDNLAHLILASGYNGEINIFENKPRSNRKNNK